MGVNGMLVVQMPCPSAMDARVWVWRPVSSATISCSASQISGNSAATYEMGQ